MPRWLCFDACPTYACLPYVAARAKALTPKAKLVVMVRGGAGAALCSSHDSRVAASRLRMRLQQQQPMYAGRCLVLPLR